MEKKIMKISPNTKQLFWNQISCVIDFLYLFKEINMKISPKQKQPLWNQTFVIALSIYFLKNMKIFPKQKQPLRNQTCVIAFIYLFKKKIWRFFSSKNNSSDITTCCVIALQHGLFIMILKIVDDYIINKISIVNGVKVTCYIYKQWNVQYINCDMLHH
jgi:hypothetical protein